MKTLIIFGFCSFMATQTYAQTPNFLFSLKATNAQGFKDSVVIGTYPYTVGSTSTTVLDGANLLGTQADTNIELRVSRMSESYQTDKRIIPFTCFEPITSPMDRGNQIIIYIYTKKWPVRLSWDSSVFVQNLCVHKSLFSLTNYSTASPSVVDPESMPFIRMAALHGSLVLDSITPFIPPHNENRNHSNITLTNGKQARFRPISFYFTHTLVGTNTKDAKKQFSLKIYPNPVDNQFAIEHNLLQGKTMIVRILNMQGQMVDSRSISRAANSHIIMTGHLPAGMYMVEMQESGVSLVSRAAFVKL